MSVNNFLILKRVKEFTLGLEKLVITFPRKDLYSREMVYKDMLDLYELIIKANIELDDKLKASYKVQAIARVSKIDFYLERAFKYKYISEGQLLNKSRELKELNKMIYTWYKNGYKIK